MSILFSKIASLFGGCRHDGLATPVRSFRGAEIWRCELCGHNVLVADDVDC